MWQKTRANIKYVFERYAYEFDWFVSCGDDTYYIVDNLRSLLGSAALSERHSRDEPLYLGRRYHKPASPNKDGASMASTRHACRAACSGCAVPTAWSGMLLSRASFIGLLCPPLACFLYWTALPAP